MIHVEQVPLGTAKLIWGAQARNTNSVNDEGSAYTLGNVELAHMLDRELCTARVGHLKIAKTSGASAYTKSA
jgi:hypothetical protein